MKKTVVLLLACVLVLSGITFAASSGYFEGFRIVNVNINGKNVVGDVPAVMLNGRTMVPLRVISETFGADVNWNNTTYTATLKTNSNGISDTLKEAIIFSEHYSKLSKFGHSLGYHGSNLESNANRILRGETLLDSTYELMYTNHNYFVERYNELLSENEALAKELSSYSAEFTKINEIMNNYYDALEKYARGLERMDYLIESIKSTDKVVNSEFVFEYSLYGRGSALIGQTSSELNYDDWFVKIKTLTGTN